jgi:hypothetical protein
MKNVMISGLVIALFFMVAPAFGAVILDEEGIGFAGKGDVQLAFDWNNSQLQNNANNLIFSVSSSIETTWECFNSNNEKYQERARTTVTQGLLYSIGRLKNQITGFNLNGFDPDNSSTTTDGNQLYSCPSGPWTFVDGSISITNGDSNVLQVCLNADCRNLSLTE